MLRQINSLNHPNLLKFFENFQHQGYRCMVFEMLHKDLHDAIVSEDLEMQLTEIRPIARQVGIIANGTLFLLKTCSYWNPL